MIKESYNRTANYGKVLALYEEMRDDHGTGRENGLEVIDIARMKHWRKTKASGALQRAKTIGRELSRPLIIDHDVKRDQKKDKNGNIVTDKNGESKIVTKHIHYIAANPKEAQRSTEKHHRDLVGKVRAERERLDIYTKQFPSLTYARIATIARRIKLIIPAPPRKSKKVREKAKKKEGIKE